MAKEKKPKKNAGKNTGFLLAPMYLFTIVFVGLPFVYLFLLSFLQRAEVWGVDFTFTLENYKRIFNPMYLGNFADSFKLAFTSTMYCIVGVSIRLYYGAHESEVEKEDAVTDINSLFHQCPYTFVWMDYCVSQ